MYHESALLWKSMVGTAAREPDFGNILKVLSGEKPSRPTLFEFFINERLMKSLTVDEDIPNDHLFWYRRVIRSFKNAGYDFAPILGSNFEFRSNRHKHQQTISLNDSQVIFDRASFESYPWPDADQCDYSRLDILSEELPGNMKLIVLGPDGVLENVIKLVGFESLCYMIADDPDLVKDIFDAVGERMVRYYEICARYDTVGALISNDDWGFKTQTMLSLQNMQEYVLPWHKKIVEAVHKFNKPVILHSCGQLEYLMDDIINHLKYDAKHSYEDAILPVEQAYQRFVGKIAIAGGIDVDFLCRSTPEEVFARAKSLLQLSEEQGGYLLGSGNSIPDYVPDENYFAMIGAALT